MNPFFCNKRIFLFLLCGAALSGSVPAQEVFRLGAEDTALLGSLLAKHQRIYRETSSKLPAAHKKDYEEVYRLRWDNIRGKFEKKEIYASADANSYLDALTGEITRANPVLKDIPFSCYFSRSGNPNASYIGEGVILFNMGLFYRLANESQVAFVICHELAHLFLRHSEKTIDNYIARITSEEVQKELRSIKKKEYRKRGPLEELVRTLTFDSRRYSRENENQADSMALEFLRNTRFDIRESLTTLAALDTIDDDTLNTALALEKTFDAPGYPFQKRWLYKEEGLLGGHAVLAGDVWEDSLKTHPDCQLRIGLMEPLVSRYSVGGHSSFSVDSGKFEWLRKIFRYEIIEYAYVSENYTRSLYYTLALLQGKPADPYLVAQVGKILNGFYKAQKDHRLGKITDLPSPYFTPNYNILLQFVQNLYPENFASISYYYLNRYHEAMGGYAPFKSAYSTSIQIAQLYIKPNS